MFCQIFIETILGLAYKCKIQYLCLTIEDQIISCAQNDEVDAINNKFFNKFPQQLKSFYSADKASIEEGADQVEAHYSTGYLNSINIF